MSENNLPDMTPEDLPEDTSTPLPETPPVLEKKKRGLLGKKEKEAHKFKESTEVPQMSEESTDEQVRLARRISSIWLVVTLVSIPLYATLSYIDGHWQMYLFAVGIILVSIYAFIAYRNAQIGKAARTASWLLYSAMCTITVMAFFTDGIGVLAALLFPVFTAAIGLALMPQRQALQMIIVGLGFAAVNLVIEVIDMPWEYYSLAVLLASVVVLVGITILMAVILLLQIRNANVAQRLIIVFMLLSMLPAAFVSGYNIISGALANNTEALRNLEDFGLLNEEKIELRLQDYAKFIRLSFSQILEQELAEALVHASGSEYQDALTTMTLNINDVLEKSPDFENIMLLDLAGKVIVTGEEAEEEFFVGADHSDQLYFTSGLEGEYISEAYFEEEDQIHTFFVSRPFVDEHGHVAGVLVAEANYGDFSELLTSNRKGLGETGETYLVAADYKLSTESRFAGYEVGADVRTEGVTAAFETQGHVNGYYEDYRGIPVLSDYLWIPEINAVLVTKINQNEISLTTFQEGAVGIFIGLLVTAVAVAGSLVIGQGVSNPLEKLLDTTRQVAAGDYNVAVEIESKDELGALAESFNTMTDVVAQRDRELEARARELGERAREMEASQRVTFAASERTTPEDFLELLVNLIVDQFDIYHCQVYLLDEEHTKAVLSQSTGFPGRQLLQQRHSIPLDQESLVTRCINSGESVLVAETEKEAGWLPNPLLPYTKSELVVPLILEDEVIGALDIQDRETNRFTPQTVPVFEAMTKQVAFLYENNELLEQIALRSEEQERFADQLRSAAEVAGQLSAVLDPSQLMNEAVALLQSRFNLYHAHIYLLDETEQNLVMEAGSGQVGLVLKERQHSISVDRVGSLVARAAREREPVLISNTNEDSDFLPNPLLPNTRSELAIPMQVGGKLIGVLDLQDEEVDRFTQVDADSLSTLAGQIATSIENARLFASRTESEAQFRTLVENAPEAIILVDTTTGLFKDPNENSVLLFGLPQNEVIKTGPANMSPPIQPDGRSSAMTYMEYLKQAMEGERPVFEWVHTNAAGVEIPCEVRLVRLPGTNNVRASITDITERKAARDAIVQGDQLKSEFLANMSHELRTPLNSIIGYTDVLLLGVDGNMDEEIRKDLEAIRDNSDHLLRLINDILDLAKIEAGRMTLELSDVDIERLFQEIIKANAGLLVNKNLQMKTEVQEGLPKIAVDKIRLNQVITNLVSNAIKFTEEGTIKLRASQENGWVKLEVEDTGKGIEHEHLGMIFEEFTQADPSSTRTKEGTGLGLAISQRLVHMHGGEISVESEMGKGSIFVVRLPIEAMVSPDVIVTNGSDPNGYIIDEEANKEAEDFMQMFNK